MTIGGWILVVFVWLIIIGCVLFFVFSGNRKSWSIALACTVAALCCLGVYAVGRWYYTSTASGIRALTDQNSNLRNGLERTINVYTANGDKIAEYHGKIDLEMDKDYIKFDWEGKRYIYYNCFVETIAEIP